MKKIDPDSVVVTPRSVYWDSCTYEAPEGYEFTREFRKPAVGEPFLGAPQGNEAVVAVDIPYGLRLILKKAELRRFVLVETGEFRMPRVGEQYVNPLGKIAYADRAVTVACKILREEKCF